MVRTVLDIFFTHYFEIPFRRRARNVKECTGCARVFFISAPIGYFPKTPTRGGGLLCLQEQVLKVFRQNYAPHNFVFDEMHKRQSPCIAACCRSGKIQKKSHAKDAVRVPKPSDSVTNLTYTTAPKHLEATNSSPHTTTPRRLGISDEAKITGGQTGQDRKQCAKQYHFGREKPPSTPAKGHLQL